MNPFFLNMLRLGHFLILRHAYGWEIVTRRKGLTRGRPWGRGRRPEPGTGPPVPGVESPPPPARVSQRPETWLR